MARYLRFYDFFLSFGVSKISRASKLVLKGNLNSDTDYRSCKRKRKDKEIQSIVMSNTSSSNTVDDDFINELKEYDEHKVDKFEFFLRLFSYKFSLFATYLLI